MAGCHHRRRHPSYYMKHRRRRRHHPYQPRDKSSQQQQQQTQSMMEDSEYEADFYIPVSIPVLDIGITSWLPLPELSGAWRWCSNTVTRSLDWMKDTVFPSRVYQRELQETKTQLMLLHQQIAQLKAYTFKVESDKLTPDCNCNCQLLLPATPHKPAMLHPGGHTPAQPTQPDNEDMQARRNGAPPGHAVAPPLPLPPPPPAPPPPPPISLPPKALVFRKKKTFKASNKRPMVTLSDIMNVKLKKVSDQDHKAAPSGLCEAGKDDVQPVKTRKRRSLHQINDENANTMVLRSRISEEAMQFRGCLRKVSTVRSPGGTPLRRKPKDSHSTGLTPLMTRALHRKFKTIRTPSPLPQDVSSISPSFDT